MDGEGLTALLAALGNTHRPVETVVPMDIPGSAGQPAYETPDRFQVTAMYSEEQALQLGLRLLLWVASRAVERQRVSDEEVR